MEHSVHAKMDDQGQSKQAWLEQVHDQMKGQLRAGLYEYFRCWGKRDDLTVPIVNQAHDFIKLALLEEAPDDSETSETEKQKAYQSQCSLFLYYRVLQSVLERFFPIPEAQQQGRFIKKQQPGKEAFTALLSADLHHSLLLCAVEVVMFITTEETEGRWFPWATNKVGMEFCMVSLWQSIRWFAECFRTEDSTSLPDSVINHLNSTGLRCLEDLGWVDGSQVYELMDTGGGVLFPQGDLTLIREFILASGTLIFHRVKATCRLLGECEQCSAQVAERIPLMRIMAEAIIDHVMSEHLDLRFGRHGAVLAGCAVYCAGRALKVNLPFKVIMDILAKKVPFPVGLSAFTGIELSPAGQDGPAELGSMRDFYNVAFLPAVEDFVRSLHGPKSPDQRPEQTATAAHNSARLDYSALQTVDAKTPARLKGKTESAVPKSRTPLRALTASDVNALRGTGAQ